MQNPRYFDDFDNQYDGQNQGRSLGPSRQDIIKKNLAEQDELIDQIAGHMPGLKTAAQNLGKEVGEQNEILDGFGNDVEKSLGQMENTNRKVAKVLKNAKSNIRWIILGILFLIAIALVIALVFILK